MKTNELDQVKSLIVNFTNTRQHIPYLLELEEHKTYGPIFTALSSSDKKEVETIIKEYIIEHITWLKTKWGLLFKRFFENKTAQFRQFRNLNNPATDSQSQEFQSMGKDIETQMFDLEWLLTQAMLKKPQWLDKVIDAFYTVVYHYFPRLGEVE